MALLRLVSNSVFRILTRDLRGVPRKVSEPLYQLSQDKLLVDNETESTPSEIESTKKSYRTFRQQVKKLKSQCSCQLVTKDNQFEMVKAAVTMFHHIPYSEQLELKQTKHKEVLERLHRMKSTRSEVNLIS